MPHRIKPETAEPLLERSTDHDKVARANAIIDRYGKILLTAAMMIAGWFTTTILAPLRAVPVVVEQQAKQDSAIKLLVIQQAETKATQKELVHAVTILTRISCLGLSERTRILSDLSCSGVPNFKGDSTQ